MTRATEYIRDKDLELYANLLREIKARMAIAEQVLAATSRTQLNADLIAVELRIVLEQIPRGTRRGMSKRMTTPASFSCRVRSVSRCATAPSRSSRRSGSLGV
jgi:hypothetical protein